MDVLRVLFKFANTIYIIEHVDTLFIVRADGDDRLRESKRTEVTTLVANKETGRRTVVRSELSCDCRALKSLTISP